MPNKPIFGSGDLPREIPAVKKYFTDNFDGEDDDNLKKVIAAGMTLRNPDIIADYPHGPGGPRGNQSIEELVQVVDSGVTTAKAAYKVATGEMDTVDAVDVLADHAAAQAATVVKNVCEHAGGVAGTAIGSAIGSIFGPAGAAAGAVIGGFVGRLAGNFVGTVIVPGVKKVAAAAKEVVHSVVEGVKEVAHSAWEGVKSAGRRILSIFGF